MDLGPGVLEAGQESHANEDGPTTFSERTLRSFANWFSPKAIFIKKITAYHYVAEVQPPELVQEPRLIMRRQSNIKDILKAGESVEGLRAHIILLPYDREIDVRPRPSESGTTLAILGLVLSLDQSSLTMLLASARNETKIRERIQLPSKARPPFDAGHKIKRHLVIPKAPIYQNDYSIYVFRPHCQNPPQATLDVAFFEPKIDGKPWLALVMCSDSMLLKKFEERVFETEEALEQDEMRLRVKEPRYTLCQVDSFCNEHNCEILDSLDKHILDLEFEGRHSPSNGKIDFLLHLENCLQCIEASVMVDPWKDIEGVSSQPAEWYSSLETDQQYIGEQSRRLREKSIALRNSIQERLNSNSTYQTTTITVLAAIYIPLTFVTGVFGMNISEINGSIPQYWHVLAMGVPLTVLTVVGPLAVGPAIRRFLVMWRHELTGQFLDWAIYTAATAYIINNIIIAKEKKSEAISKVANITLVCSFTLLLTRNSWMEKKGGLMDVLIRASIVSLQLGFAILTIAFLSCSKNIEDCKNLAEWSTVFSNLCLLLACLLPIGLRLALRVVPAIWRFLKRRMYKIKRE